MKPRRKRGEGSIYLRGRIWWIKYSVNGEPIHESGGSDKESEARKLLKRRLGEIAIGRFIGPDAEKVTIRELAQDYLNDYRVNARKSLDKAERMVKRYDEEDKETDSGMMAYFGDLKAHSVGTDRVRAYTAKRIEEGAANATINRNWLRLSGCSI